VIRRFRWAAVGAVALIAAAAVSLEVPYQAFSGEIFVRFEHGAGTPALARTLQAEGVIRYAWQFWLERALHPSAKLQAGEYRFAEAASVSGVYARISRGDVYYFDVNVPEGSNMFDIARLLEASGAMPARDFLRAAEDPSLIRDLDPKAPTLEGYLFPATYRLSHSTTAEELCRMMTAEFRRQWKKLTVDDPSSPHQVVTLASLVEKETGLAAERPLVAGVFVHRLKLGMLLDCDPTTIYASLLDRRYRGVIHQSDLDNPDPYNTYKNAGLPPGPIANPGADSIRAALHPAETDFLYFVAKPSGGGHQFSTTLAAHEKAVQKYRHGTKRATKTARRAKRKKR
jgi:UPF0755 protein